MVCVYRRRIDVLYPPSRSICRDSVIKALALPSTWRCPYCGVLLRRHFSSAATALLQRKLHHTALTIDSPLRTIYRVHRGRVSVAQEDVVTVDGKRRRVGSGRGGWAPGILTDSLSATNLTCRVDKHTVFARPFIAVRCSPTLCRPVATLRASCLLVAER